MLRGFSAEDFTITEFFRVTIIISFLLDTRYWMKRYQYLIHKIKYVSRKGEMDVELKRRILFRLHMTLSWRKILER